MTARAEAGGVEGGCADARVSIAQTLEEERGAPTITTGHGLGVAEGGSGEGSKEDSGEAHGENDKRVLSGERHRAKRTVMECEGELQTEESHPANRGTYILRDRASAVP